MLLRIILIDLVGNGLVDIYMYIDFSCDGCVCSSLDAYMSFNSIVDVCIDVYVVDLISPC